MDIEDALGKKRELNCVGSLPQLSLAGLMDLSLVDIW